MVSHQGMDGNRAGGFGATNAFTVHVNYPQVHQLYKETFTCFMSEASVFLLYVHITGTYLHRNIRKLYNFYVL